MAKNKLKKFEQMDSFENVIQPDIKDLLNIDFALKGNWNKEYFKNDNPIVLEVGAGKAEYTVALAEKYPDKNFIALDIKGARLWAGAKYALEKNLKNAVFMRTKIDFITSFFAKDEVCEIWIPFPDPQPQKQRKRLVAPMFLNRYRAFIKQEAIINLKTDNIDLFDYASEMLKENNIEPIEKIEDLYNSETQSDVKITKTFYEDKFLKKDAVITFLKFRINRDNELVDIDFDKK